MVTDSRAFEARAGGRVLARARAWVTPGLRAGDGAPAGAIGGLESGDACAFRGVLDEAVAWLAGRGLGRALAPMNGDIWHGYRAMTRGFELEPYLGEPRTPPEQAEELEAAGFVVHQRWHSFELPGRGPLDALAAAHSDARRALPASGYRLQPLDGVPLDALSPRLHEVLGRSFEGFLGYTPIPEAEFRVVLGPALPALLRGASVLLLDPAGADAGFSVAFDDRVEPRLRRSLLHLGGLVPEARGRGVARGVLGDVIVRLRALERATVLVTLVAEGSPVRRLFGPFAEDRRREYALFERRT